MRIHVVHSTCSSLAMSRKCYSLDFKLKVIEEAESSQIPKKDLCAKFKIAPSTLSTFLKNKNKIRGNRDTGLFSGKRKKCARCAIRQLKERCSCGSRKCELRASPSVVH